MLSIITAVHNGLAMNEVFLEHLKKYTHHPYELIIIDNCSIDGSRELFKRNGAVIIENSKNYSYPFCQNQGIKVAKYDYFAFLNNDIIVAPDWDKHLIEVMKEQKLDVLTSTGIERMETVEATKKLKSRWKRIKISLSLFGKTKNNFIRMHRWMYGNWETFTQKRWNEFGNKIIEGFVGNTVLMTRNAIEKIGLWDERIQSADFDLYVRAKKRWLENKDIKPCHIALGVFNHHYIRVTVSSGPTEFADKNNLISLEEKWGKEPLKLYLADNISI